MGHYDDCYEQDEKNRGKTKIIPCPVCGSKDIGEGNTGEEFCRNCGVVLRQDRDKVRKHKNMRT